MFEIGFLELLLVGAVALLVLGPERLPHAARMIAALLRRARASWLALKTELEHELEREARERIAASRPASGETPGRASRRDDD